VKMPKAAKSSSEWETRILQFVAGKSFGQEQRPSKTTKWGKIVEKIEKGPMRTLQSRGRDVMGRLRVCDCGYPVKSVVPVKNCQDVTTTKPTVVDSVSESGYHVKPVVHVKNCQAVTATKPTVADC
ncbi:Uncharacterized protein APZ42_005365, partial [Daphnia magna]